MLHQLDHDDRMQLLKFVCSFAWADLEVRPEEVAFVSRLFHRLELNEVEWVQVKSWLDVPPSPEAVDPTRVPLAHRKLFVEFVEGVIAADEEIAESERENLHLFKQLIP